MLSEEFEDAPPRIRRSLLVVDLRSLIVEKAMIDAGVDVNFDRLTKFFQLSFELVHKVRRYESIAFAVDAKHRRLQARQVGCVGWICAIKDHAGTDLRVFGRRVKRKRASHAKAYDTNLASRCGLMTEQKLNCPAQVLFSLIDAQGHH